MAKSKNKTRSHNQRAAITVKQTSKRRDKEQSAAFDIGFGDSCRFLH